MVPSTAPASRFTGHFPLAPGNQINIWYGISCWGTGQGNGGNWLGGWSDWGSGTHRRCLGLRVGLD